VLTGNACDELFSGLSKCFTELAGSSQSPYRYVQRYFQPVGEYAEEWECELAGRFGCISAKERLRQLCSWVGQVPEHCRFDDIFAQDTGDLTPLTLHHLAGCSFSELESICGLGEYRANIGQAADIVELIAYLNRVLP